MACNINTIFRKRIISIIENSLEKNQEVSNIINISHQNVTNIVENMQKCTYVPRLYVEGMAMFEGAAVVIGAEGG